MAIPAYYSLIQKGSSGPDVALVQTWLNGIRDACTWHDILKADGRFGTACEKAVTEFQLRNKLKVDGKVGANTWNALYAKYTAAHGLHVPYPGIVIRQGSSGGTVRLIQQKLRAVPVLGTVCDHHGRRAAVCLAAGDGDGLHTASAGERQRGTAVFKIRAVDDSAGFGIFCGDGSNRN